MAPLTNLYDVSVYGLVMKRTLCALLISLTAGCNLGPDDLPPITGVWWGWCCAESTLHRGIRWELWITEGPAGSVSGQVGVDGLGERRRLGRWDYEGRVSGSVDVDDGSIVLHLVFVDLPPHRFEGRRISKGRMDGRIADLGDVKFARPGYK